MSLRQFHKRKSIWDTPWNCNILPLSQCSPNFDMKNISGRAIFLILVGLPGSLITGHQWSWYGVSSHLLEVSGVIDKPAAARVRMVGLKFSHHTGGNQFQHPPRDTPGQWIPPAHQFIGQRPTDTGRGAGNQNFFGMQFSPVKYVVAYIRMRLKSSWSDRSIVKKVLLNFDKYSIAWSYTVCNCQP